MWGFTTLGITLGVWLGMPYLEAQTLLYLLAFLVYASVFCWGFTVQRTAVVWTVLAGGGVAMTLLGWCLGRFYLT